MNVFAKRGEYEKAAQARNKIFSLNHIQDVALIKSEDDGKRSGPKESFRIESYDVAHLSGTNNVGVMVVMENGEFKKSDYRKFKIRNSSGNDIGALAEILERRLKHADWPWPNLIVLDGGLAQLNTAKRVYQGSALGIHKGLALVDLIAVTKDEKHQPKVIIGDEIVANKYKKEILQINNEAHRFAIKYHRSKRLII